MNNDLIMSKFMQLILLHHNMQTGFYDISSPGSWLRRLASFFTHFNQANKRILAFFFITVLASLGLFSRQQVSLSWHVICTDPRVNQFIGRKINSSKFGFIPTEGSSIVLTIRTHHMYSMLSFVPQLLR